MKLKVDDKGNAILNNGLPVYVYEDGQESPFDAKSTMDLLNGKISKLEEEKDRHFKDKDKFKGQLKDYDGIDPVKAREALRIVKSLEDKQLLDANGVDALKKEWQSAMTNSFEDEKRGLINGFTQEKQSWEQKDQDMKSMIFDLAVYNKFATSEYFAGEAPKTILPPEYASKIFGNHFEMKIDGRNLKIVAKDSNGKEIYSKKNHGELADFNEAIGQLVEEHNKRYSIMNPGKGGGPRSSGNLGPAGPSKNSADMTPQEKIRAGLKKQYGIG